MTQKTLEEWLTHLENQHSQEIQLGLARISKIADRLKLRCPNAPVITVAGTNGKGSTVAILEAIYREAGYNTASYTSPHLLTFHERIKINAKPISDKQLITAFELIEEARGDVLLTYFEVVTLAALWHFKQHPLDVIILETGMGGRLDATNCVDSELAIITTIDKDHEAYLGHSIESIASEKAGILRSGKPFIYADRVMPDSIAAKAAELKTISYQNGKDYRYECCDEGLLFHYGETTLALPASIYHSNSVAAAIMATLCLQQRLPVKDSQRIEGIKNTVLSGRLQWLHESHPVLLDVAHNPQAANYLAAYLNETKSGKKIHAVFSAFTDKDILGLIAPLKPLVHRWYPALLSNKRAASAHQLLDALQANEISASLCYHNPILAYEAALSEADADDVILVYGSFITVSHVLSTLTKPVASMEVI